VAVSAGGIFTSPDAVSWTSQDSGIYDQINAITFARGIFVAVGGTTHPDKWTYTTSVILTSTNGLNWTSVPLTISSQFPYFYGWPLTGVVYGGDTFVAVGTGDQAWNYNNADAILTSPDGVNWSVRPSEPGPGLNRIATGNGRLMAVGQG